VTIPCLNGERQIGEGPFFHNGELYNLEKTGWQIIFLQAAKMAKFYFDQ
jgi:hypothetical protein